jgi:hypothetical protein
MESFDPISFERDAHLLTSEQLKMFILLARKNDPDDQRVATLARAELKRR